MRMKLKIPRKGSSNLSWTTWILFSVMNIGMLVLILTPLDGFTVFADMIILNVVLIGILKFYTAKLNTLDYIVLDDAVIEIKPGLFTGKKTIPYNEIEAVMEHNGVMRIQEKSSCETSISLCCIDLMGIRELRKRIEENCSGKIL